MKKIIAVLLALVMVLSLAACTGSTAPNSTDAPQQTQGNDTPATSEATEPAASEQTQGNDTPTDPEVTEPAEPQTNAERYPLESNGKTYTIANRQANPNDREVYPLWEEVTGVSIDWVEMSGDVLSSAVAGGSMPDAICISWGLDKNTVYEYGSAGKFVNFADYLEYMPNFQKVLELYPNSLDNYRNEDGSFYSLPPVSGGFGAPGNLLYARMDMVEKAGLSLPTTIDEFKQFILDLQEFYSDVEGFQALNFFMGGEWGYLEWNGLMDNYFFPAFGDEALQTGYDLVDGKVVLGCATEQYKRYLEFISWVYASGACEQDIFSADCTNANKAKSAANLVAVSPTTGLNASNFESGVVELELLPPLTSEWQSDLIWTNTTIPTWMLNCINGELPEEDIITLVKWFDAFYADDTDPLNEEGTITGMFIYMGEEGVHFEVNEEEGTYRRLVTGDWSTTQEWASNEICSTSLYSKWFKKIEYANSAFYCKQVGVREKLWPHMVERWAPTSLFLDEDESYEAASIGTDLNLYMESSFAKFIVGEWTVEANWDEYIKGLESLGAFDLVDIYQTAYDRQN